MSLSTGLQRGLIQEEKKRDIDAERGVQISIVAKKIVTKG